MYDREGANEVIIIFNFLRIQPDHGTFFLGALTTGTFSVELGISR
jgi:hypothetical protein